MASVAIHDIQLGSRLAKAILDPEGRVVLAEGAVLRQNIVEKLERWQISSVSVLQSTNETAGEGESLSNHFRQLFDQNDLSQQQEILHQAMTKWFQNRISAEDSA